MRITIRFSILSFFVALLLMVGFSIVVINYYILDDMLLKSAKRMLSSSSNLIKSEIVVYLQPLHESAGLTGRLLTNEVLHPGDSFNYRNYLINLIVSNPNILAAYWGMPTGDHNTMEKTKGESSFEHILIYRTKIPQYENRVYLDNFGRVIKQEKHFDFKFDPRVRPWFKKAVKEKKQTWSNIYQFTAFLTKEQRVSMGISAVVPVYSKDGKLRGVFGLDTTLNNVAKFMSNLEVSKNTAMFIIDPNGHFMASNNTYKLAGMEKVRKLQNISDLNIPWVKLSFDLYKKVYRKEGKQVFLYKFEGEKYIAAYQTIDQVLGKDWYVGVTLPVSDVIGPLKNNLLWSVEVAFFVLLLGMFCARFIAGRIARPIKDLSNEARSLANLKFREGKRIKSFIDEIYEMQSAFDTMKSALSSFTRYIPIALVQRLIKSGQVAHVGGENKEITVLFSDIRGFTSLSENMPPAQLMTYLSKYFEAMTTAILEHNGTVDKYIGDAIMAFWGAPLPDNKHTLHACKCALSLMGVLKKFNVECRAEGQPEISIRIGINKGEMIIGNVGSNDRLSYTAIGDNVNLASRLEGLNKNYNTAIMVSESVYGEVKDDLQFRLLDRVAVRGKKQGGYVFELLSPIDNPFKEKLTHYNDLFRKAFSVYEQGEWDEAIRLFKEIQKDYPEDKLLNMYIERCSLLQQEKPKNWHGVWIAEKKSAKRI